MTRDTAEAIAATDEENAHWGFCEAGVDYEHLQTMARLYLMLPEITQVIETLDCERDVDFGTKPDPQDVLARLKSLEK